MTDDVMLVLALAGLAVAVTLEWWARR